MNYVGRKSLKARFQKKICTTFSPIMELQKSSNQFSFLSDNL